MIDKYGIGIHDGTLCVIWTSNSWTAPEWISHYWPVTGDARTFLSYFDVGIDQLSGFMVDKIDTAIYRVSHPQRPQSPIYLNLRDQGQTRPIYGTTAPYKCTARGQKKYQNGQWWVIRRGRWTQA